MNAFADLLRQRIKNRPEPTVANVLDLLHYLSELSIKEDCRGRFWDMQDAITVIEDYVYSHATSEELQVCIDRNKERHERFLKKYPGPRT